MKTRQVIASLVATALALIITPVAFALPLDDDADSNMSSQAYHTVNDVKNAATAKMGDTIEIFAPLLTANAQKKHPNVRYIFSLQPWGENNTFTATDLQFDSSFVQSSEQFSIKIPVDCRLVSDTDIFYYVRTQDAKTGKDLYDTSNFETNQLSLKGLTKACAQTKPAIDVALTVFDDVNNTVVDHNNVKWGNRLATKIEGLPEGVDDYTVHFTRATTDGYAPDFSMWGSVNDNNEAFTSEYIACYSDDDEGVVNYPDTFPGKYVSSVSYTMPYKTTNPKIVSSTITLTQDTKQTFTLKDTPPAKCTLDSLPQPKGVTLHYLVNGKPLTEGMTVKVGDTIQVTSDPLTMFYVNQQKTVPIRINAHVPNMPSIKKNLSLGQRIDEKITLTCDNIPLFADIDPSFVMTEFDVSTDNYNFDNVTNIFFSPDFSIARGTECPTPVSFSVTYFDDSTGKQVDPSNLKYGNRVHVTAGPIPKSADTITLSTFWYHPALEGQPALSVTYIRNDKDGNVSADFNLGCYLPWSEDVDKDYRPQLRPHVPQTFELNASSSNEAFYFNNFGSARFDVTVNDDYKNCSVEAPPIPTGPGTTDPGTEPGTEPGPTDPGTTDPGTTDPDKTDPGTTDPGTTDPGTTDPGTKPGTTDPDAKPGTDPGTAPGTQPGTKPGTSPGTTDPGTKPGTTPPGTHPGKTDNTGNTDTGPTTGTNKKPATTHKTLQLSKTGTESTGLITLASILLLLGAGIVITRQKAQA
ncbi:MAG: hypothetical protein Q4P66_07980 [Actinomycetaceae bacterium]|nr:hypothetical protein [Actinomycetaceae bacterium]